MGLRMQRHKNKLCGDLRYLLPQGLGWDHTSVKPPSLGCGWTLVWPYPYSVMSAGNYSSHLIVKVQSSPSPWPNQPNWLILVLKMVYFSNTTMLIYCRWHSFHIWRVVRSQNTCEVMLMKNSNICVIWINLTEDIYVVEYTPISHKIKTTDRCSEKHWLSCYNDTFQGVGVILGSKYTVSVWSWMLETLTRAKLW